MNIIFVCGARDFHAMDKFRLTTKALYPRKVLLLTDLIESENQAKRITDEDPVYHLLNIDQFLLKKQSSFGNIWRNLVKLLVLPIQVNRLKAFYKKHPDCIYHAIPMYYMMLCYLAKVPFVGTPQGSEILVRPKRSKLYRRYAIKSLQAAKKVIVDSLNMQREVHQLSGVNALILKNGFDTTAILKSDTNPNKKHTVLSIRGFNPLYRIEKILEARNHSSTKPAISFLYPASEQDYKVRLKKHFKADDLDFGRLGKEQLYETMRSTLLVVSIPESDSSPRSVYESIFAGAAVAVTYSNYLEELPDCMKARIYIVDLEDKNWLDKALEFAKEITKTPYMPSEAALDMCEEKRTIKKLVDNIYKPELWNQQQLVNNQI